MLLIEFSVLSIMTLSEIIHKLFIPFIYDGEYNETDQYNIAVNG